jgi:hypothetical protein
MYILYFINDKKEIVYNKVGEFLELRKIVEDTIHKGNKTKGTKAILQKLGKGTTYVLPREKAPSKKK